MPTPVGTIATRPTTAHKYSVSKDADIAALPVESIAADDAFLFLWITMPKLPVAFDVIKAWGFKYKTCAFTWVKRNRVSRETWFTGMGHYTRANAELCLLGTRGRPRRVDASVHQIIDTPIEGHSKKPDEARRRIVQLCGDLPRIELFARERVAGWEAWGNEL